MRLFTLVFGIVLGAVLHHHLVKDRGSHNPFDRAVDKGEAALKSKLAAVQDPSQPQTPATEKAREALNTAADKVGDVADDVAAKVADTADKAAAKVSDTADKAATKTRKTANKAAGVAKEKADEAAEATVN